MPTQYSIDVHDNIVRTTFTGTITAREVSEYSARLHSDPGFRPRFSELVIFEGNPDVHLSYLDWQSLSGCDPFLSTSKHAYVVHGRNAVYGAIRMCQCARNDTTNIRIFDAVDEALAWLSATVPQARAEGR